MKYRLVELLRCPAHPEAMLRVTGAHVSEVFPFSGELQIPVCRTGCAYLGNWFTEIPESLPSSHRFDCRRCMGNEIEIAELTCPECGWSLKVADGVLQPDGGSSLDPIPESGPLHRKAGAPIEKHLALQPGEIALVLASLPESTVEKWCSKGIERLQVELSSEVLLSGRAMSCANGLGMVHFLGGPIDLSVLRPGEFDALIVLVPSGRLAGYPDALGDIPSLLRRSGRAILIYERDRNASRRASDRLNDLTRELPLSFRDLDKRILEVPGLDLILVEHPELENGPGLDVSRVKSRQGS